MSVHEIRLLGDPVLRKKCRPVEAVDDEVRRLVDDLAETMYEADGIGLAAPQIGVSVRVFVYDVRDPDVPAGALINPEIVESEGMVKEEEGCLSIPGLAELVERRAKIVMRALDREGREVRIEADGLLSRCLQHELDHLDGVLFVDHLSPLKRRMLLKRWSKAGKRKAG
ncbi:MAG: peptide deformylase [Gemmatimonadota bacterium]